MTDQNNTSTTAVRSTRRRKGGKALSGALRKLGPHSGHLCVMAGFAGYATGWAALQRRIGRPGLASPGPLELTLTAAATFRLSRLLTKATVTRPIRAPFTHVDAAGGPAELNETPRKELGRETLGELISCPFCLSLWIVTTLTGARSIWPETTRTVAGALAALTLSDALQFGYSALAKRAEQ
ncbi:DUF1360 domain-containing protein [Streptomyces sp. NPDC095817]|uniref:DUF1360 domain-containing protein n=1 Tax=Streptomyces sp. NPDC095817 TaxID=3155082 RepID=UPI003329E406